MLTDLELANAFAAGRYAHENARGLDACPMFAMGQQGAEWRAEWVRGWHAADRDSGYLRTRSSTKPEPGRAAPVRSGKPRRK